MGLAIESIIQIDGAIDPFQYLIRPGSLKSASHPKRKKSKETPLFTDQEKAEYFNLETKFSSNLFSPALSQLYSVGVPASHWVRHPKL